MNAEKVAGEPEEKLSKRLNIYLADTLESPNKAPPGGLDLTHKALTQEHEAARKVKQGGDIVVCLGNPPYDRQTIEEGDTTTQRKGGWVRFGDQVKGAAKEEEQGQRAIFKDFTDPATKAGAGVHLKNLYNDYVYFWRWALWRLFEQQKCGGIVTFITASSYLAGPGFVGMRELMRRTFDELWIIDLGGDNLGTRKTPNVFNIQTPVAIAIGMRGAKPSSDTPAKVHYAKINGDTRDHKLTQLDGITGFGGIAWRDCPDGWHKPFLPAGKGDYSIWPKIEDLFPWTHSGAQFKRSWPIGETEPVLSERYARLVAAKPQDRNALFKESRDRKVTWRPADKSLTSVYQLTPDCPPPPIARYAFRSFDRQYALIDPRFGDYLRAELQETLGAQCFFTTLMTTPLGFGPALSVCANLPDLHHFRGSFGGKDVIPLYRDAAGTEPNMTKGLLDVLGKEYGKKPAAEDVAAYVYAVLGGQSYTHRFWNELETPGPRVPVTKDRKTFIEAATLGYRLMWLHTYAERFQSKDRGDEVPQGKATMIKGVATEPAHYPVEYSYDPTKCEIVVGDGRIGPVAPEVWEFEVSGLKVVQSWLGYRMKKRAGKKSSKLDEIRPERWTARMSDELLEMLWVIEATLAMEPKLEKVLDKIVANPCFTAAQLPTPQPEERRAPGAVKTGGLLEMMGVEEVSDDDDEG